MKFIEIHISFGGCTVREKRLPPPPPPPAVRGMVTSKWKHWLGFSDHLFDFCSGAFYLFLVIAYLFIKFLLEKRVNRNSGKKTKTNEMR